MHGIASGLFFLSHCNRIKLLRGGFPGFPLHPHEIIATAKRLPHAEGVQISLHERREWCQWHWAPHRLE